jgi:hypothetical protein
LGDDTVAEALRESEHNLATILRRIKAGEGVADLMDYY